MDIQSWRLMGLLMLASWLADVPCQADMTIRVDEATGRYTFHEDDAPILTYNFGNVPVPEGVGRRYAVARSDYVHPLYGPTGEILTKDYSPDHPHHRGIYWAWPEVTYKGEKRDLHALQGVFARPVRIVRQQAEADGATLEAEDVWKWGDDEPIVREHTVICVRAAKGQRRLIDFQFRFEALKEGVAIARRGKTAYGGLNMRFSSRQGQRIVTHTDPPETQARRAWAQLAGVPPGGEKPVGVVILQHGSNPDYPGDWIQYPNLNWLQPTFPKSGTAYELAPSKPLVLKYRLIICGGEMDEEELAERWDAYTRRDK